MLNGSSIISLEVKIFGNDQTITSIQFEVAYMCCKENNVLCISNIVCIYIC